METIGKIIAVAAGGALGAVARYLVNNSFLALIFHTFPLPTFLINITGSFLIGFFFVLATDRIEMSEHLKLFVSVGFLGAYTTFSTYEFEIFSLIQARAFLNAALYAVLSLALGLTGVWLGTTLARKI